MRIHGCTLKGLTATVLLLLTVMPLLQAQEGEVFKVQVASTKIRYSAERISSDLRIREPLSIHFIDGRYKYFVGSFAMEAEALRHARDLRVEGAYVVKLPSGLEDLNDAHRISQPDTLATKPLAPDLTLQESTDSLTAADAIPVPMAREQNGKPAPINRNLLIYGIGAVVAAVVLILVIMLIIKAFQKRRARLVETARDRIKERLSEALLEMGENDRVLPTREMTHLEKQVLIEEIMKLYPNLSGEIGNRMRELYISTGLKHESAAKLQSLDWKVRAEGFRELAVLNVPVAIEEIERCLNSNNMVLRTEARLALIRLDRDDPWCFLSRMKKPFTEWEQLQVYELLKGGGVVIPDFGRWMDTANDSVVIFCIRMTRAFNQGQSYLKLVQLLDHGNNEIRKEAIIALGHFRKPEALPLLIERYGAEEKENKIQVIQSVANIPDEKAATFLQGILDPEEELRLEAAEALAGMESVGLEGIEDILRKSEEKLQAVGRYLLMKRLGESSGEKSAQS